MNDIGKMQQYAKYREKEQNFKLYFMLRQHLIYDIIYLIMKLYVILEPSLYYPIIIKTTYQPKQLLCIEYHTYSEKGILMDYLAQDKNLHVFSKIIEIPREAKTHLVIGSSSTFLFYKPYKQIKTISFTEFYSTCQKNKKYNIDLNGCLCFNKKGMIVHNDLFNRFVDTELRRKITQNTIKKYY